MFNPGCVTGGETSVTGGETSVMTNDNFFTAVKVHLFMIDNKDNHDHD